VTAPDTHRAIDAVWRIESAKVIAGLVRMVRDVGLAEDLAHDALVAALQQWPESGIPRNPGAWLMAAAKHRAIDHFRRHKLLDRKPAIDSDRRADLHGGGLPRSGTDPRVRALGVCLRLWS
jgi:predicted RNA polymerase sigma factor